MPENHPPAERSVPPAGPEKKRVDFAPQIKPRGARDGTRNDLFLRFGVNFRWNEHLTLSGYYSFEDVDSEVSDSYSANIVGARASYRF